MRASFLVTMVSGLVLAVAAEAQDVEIVPTVNAWKAKTKINVTPAATMMLERTIADPATAIFHSGNRQVDKEESQWIVDSYLYEVRDKTCVLSKCGSGITEGNLGQVKFESFASGIVTLNVKPGRLVVHSVPAGATIQIDDTPKGQTDKTFVMSPGSHAVEISNSSGLRCRRSVTINSGDTTGMSCPESVK
jgi:hypothetical protein